MRSRKLFIQALIIFIVFQHYVPLLGNVNVLANQNSPANWPAVFTPYTDSNGNPIFDPGGDVNPVDVDITSGVNRGVGNLPSLYYASDEENFFIRMRLKGDPYDRKGGFLSSVWLVKLADSSGEPKATIGLNGKSPHVDYVYVANANGTDVTRIYETPTSGGNLVPGTRIVSAENGHYFLDFQVPISAVSSISGGAIQANTPVKLLYGTSKAANLSVINKERIDSGFGEAIKMNSQPPTVSIDGGDRREYNSSTGYTITGKTSIATGNVTLNINGVTNTAVINNHSWSLNLATTTNLPKITEANGTYRVSATVTKDGKSATAIQEVIIKIDGTNSITINGGPVATTNSETPTISGTVAGGGGSRVHLFVNGIQITTGNGINANQGTWSGAVPVANKLSPNIPYTIRAEYQHSNGTWYAAATQQLTFIPNSAGALPTITISSITPAGDAKPTISGTSSGASQVEVRINGILTEIAIPNESGVWSVPSLEKPLATGPTHTVTAIAKNSVGSASHSMNHSVNQTAITIDNGPSVTINDNKPTISGNTNALGPVSVTIGDKGPFTSTVTNGRWRIEVPDSSPISDGTHTVTASVTGATASQQLTIDTNTSVSINDIVHEATQTPAIISGTAEVGALIDLRIKNSNDDIVFIGSDKQANANEYWEYSVSSTLSEDTYTVTAVATDLYGNEAT